MVNKFLLQKELDYYKKSGKDLKCGNITKNMINSLFKDYNNYGMFENSYCCNGENVCCWQEIIEGGVFDRGLESIQDEIRKTLRHLKKYSYNTKGYCERFYIYKDKERCTIYFYGRDMDIETDFIIWFENKM